MTCPATPQSSGTGEAGAEVIPWVFPYGAFVVYVIVMWVTAPWSRWNKLWRKWRRK